MNYLICLTSSYLYTYNTVGYRDSMTTLTGRHGYTYDDLYRLTAADHPDSTDESYSYDALGNRISQMAENRSQRTDGRNQKTGFSLSSVLSSLSSVSYTYNEANQLLDSLFARLFILW